MNLRVHGLATRSFGERRESITGRAAKEKKRAIPVRGKSKQNQPIPAPTHAGGGLDGVQSKTGEGRRAQRSHQSDQCWSCGERKGEED